MTAPSPAAGARLEAYLAEVAADLRGPRRRRGQILAELRDGLEQAVADRAAAGQPAQRAAVEAIAEFGTPSVVARAFAAELGIARARRVLACFVVTGPLVGIWWLLLLDPRPWRGGLPALVATIPVLPLVAAGLAAAGTTFATTGRLMRWLPEASPGRAAAAVVTVATLTILGDLTMIGGYLWAVPEVRPLAVVAIGASLIRLGASLVTLRRTAAWRDRAGIRGSTRVGQ